MIFKDEFHQRCDVCTHSECSLSLQYRKLADCKYCKNGEIRMKDLKGNIEAYCSNEDQCEFYLHIKDVHNSNYENDKKKLSKCTDCGFGLR